MESDMTSTKTPDTALRPGALDRVGSARFLSISTRKLDDLLSAGTIKKIKVGRKTLVRVCDLDRYLAELAGEVVQ